MSKRYIIIEGLIGVGKTTLCTSLAQHYNGEALLEPAEGRNPYLALYYKDPQRWGYTMQTYLLAARYRAHQAAQSLVLADRCDVISDRSIYGDRVFARMLYDMDYITQDEYHTYMSLSKDMCCGCLYPTCFLHLRATPQIALQRITQRQHEITGRDCESAITLDYMQRLADGIDEMIDALRKYALVYTISATYYNDGHEKSKDEILQEAIISIDNIPVRDDGDPWQGVI